LRVEGGEERAQALVRHRPFAERAGQLEALVLVAQVGGALELDLVARDLLAVEPDLRLRFQIRPRRLEDRERDGSIRDVALARARGWPMSPTRPAAASSTPRRRGRPTRAWMAARAALTSRGSSPPRSAAGMRPSTRWASVTVGSLPPRR